MSSTLADLDTITATQRRWLRTAIAILLVGGLASAASFVIMMIASQQPQFKFEAVLPSQKQVQVTINNAVQPAGSPETIVTYDVTMPDGQRSTRRLTMNETIKPGDKLTVWQNQDTGETSLTPLGPSDNFVPTTARKVNNFTPYSFFGGLVLIVIGLVVLSVTTRESDG